MRPDISEQISVGAQSLVRNANRLGLTWLLRVGTVISSVDSNRLEVRLDGDEANLTAVSIVGEVVAGRRVYVISIPPAGNYVIGWVGQIFPGQRIATTTETTISAGFTAETIINTVTAALVSGRTYAIGLFTGITSTVAGDNAEFRIREDNVAGTQLQVIRKDLLATNITEVVFLYAQYTAVATGSKTFVGTGFRQAGTGTLTRNTSPTAPAYMYVEYVG
jgi:hypothetical protein